MKPLFVRLFIAELLKIKRSGFYLILIGFPLLILIIYSYFCISVFKQGYQEIFKGCILVFTLISPFTIGLSVCKFLDIEKKCGNFHELLSAYLGRRRQLSIKISFYIFIYWTSSIFIFSLLILFLHLIYNIKCIEWIFLLSILYILLITQLMTICYSFFIYFQFKRNYLLAISIISVLLNALLMTPLGNGLWFYFPSAWSSILTHYFYVETQILNMPFVKCLTIVHEHIFYILLVTLLTFISILYWFGYFEKQRFKAS